MKRFSKQATAIALLAVSIFAVPSGNTAIAALSNCASVKKTYPFGIALDKKSVGTSRAKVNRTKYIQLKYLDKDLDGIVCEKEKLQTKVTTSTTTPRTTATTTTTTTTTISVTTTTQQVCASGGACSVGNRGPGGGIVFYDAGSTQSWGRYLEAAPSDLAQYPWDDAINAAQAYTGGSLSGWRLPTKDELNLLYLNRGLVGGFVACSYWSSSEYSASKAFYHNFLLGNIGYATKIYGACVRPVRAF